MRVTIVTNTYPPADITGVGALVVELARQLDAEGHDVLVVSRTAPAGDRFARPTGGRRVLFPLRAAVAFLRAAPADLVNVLESDGVLVALALRGLRLLGRRRGRARLVAILQVSYGEEARAVRPIHADGRVVSRPTAAERRFARRRAPLLARLGRLTARLADAVVACSTETAHEVVADYGVREVVAIPNGVALPPVTEPPARPAGTIRVLYGGRLRTRKAVAVLVEAFAELARRRPGCELVLAGDGPQRAALERQAAERGVAGAVAFRGALPPERMAVELRDADVFCLPSIYEGMPLAVLEAMAAGRPVVASAVSGIPEALGDAGILVPPESAAALAEALDRLADDPELRRRLGAAARRRVEERFAIGIVARRYLGVWRRLLADEEAG